MFRFVFAVIFILFVAWRFKSSSIELQAKQVPQERVIYGEDNRMDFFEVEDTRWSDKGMATVALFDFRDLKWDEDHYQLRTSHYGNTFGLCEDEPFFDQPTGSFCSGFLFSPEMVVTAGHCIRNHFNCENVRFVFGYSYPDPDFSPDRVDADQVFQCEQILFSQSDANGVDLAVILLDRTAPYEPLQVRQSGVVSEDDHFTVIGYPKGIPGKISHGGELIKNDHPQYFVSNVDTYGGSSGSAVINTKTGDVEGVLVRGEKDFVYDKEDRCRRSYRCPNDGCRGEDIVRISEALSLFPRIGLNN